MPMKKVILVLFVIFLAWMGVGGYLEYTEHPKGPVVMGLGVLFLSFSFTAVQYYMYSTTPLADSNGRRDGNDAACTLL